MITKEDANYIIGSSPTMTIDNLYEYFNKKYSKEQIRNYFKNNHIPYKKLSLAQRKHNISIAVAGVSRNRLPNTEVNVDYFKTWTKNMAYIFGLWCADGYIGRQNKGYYWGIKLNDIDKYLLEKIDIVMGGKHKLYKNQNTYSLVFSCKTIYQDIVALGGVERKSLTLEFPYVPTEYLSHFIRGYFDGDGWAGKHKCSVLGTYSFCNQMIRILNSQGICVSGIKQKHPENGLTNNCYEIGIYHKEEWRKFMEYIYSDMDVDTLYMNRKYSQYCQPCQRNTI